jgi:hypothetical protein
MLYTIFLTVIVYSCLIIIGSNLLHFIVLRHKSPHLNDKNEPQFRTGKGKKVLCFLYLINVLSFLTSIVYYYFIYHFFNAGMVSAAVMLMFSGLPGIIIQKKTSYKTGPVNKREKAYKLLTATLSILALPLVFISFCSLE